MRKVALIASCFITLLLSCTPRPEDKLESGNDGSAIDHDRRQSDPSREYYVLPVETVGVNRSAGGVSVEVRGPLGDGCQKFEYIDSIRSGATLNLTFWASRPKAKDVACTMIMQYYDRQLVLRSGEYSEVAVHSQDNNIIRKPL